MKYIPFVSTLEQIYEEITERFPFITFRVQLGSQIISNVTIPTCRFRKVEHLIEARSCDCEGEICMKPTQRLHMSPEQMKNWVLIENHNFQHYIFSYRVD